MVKSAFPEPDGKTIMDATEQETQLYGVRVSVTEQDPFASLVGKDWETTHWFDTEKERDRALRDMSREHEYSRRGDKPTLRYETINRNPPA